MLKRATNLMVQVIAAFAVLTLFALSHAVAEEKAKGALLAVQLKPVVELGSESSITLGDLVVSRGIDEKLVEALKAIKLADAPAAGETRIFTETGLQETFRSHSHIISEIAGRDVALKTPSRVRVTRKSFEFKTETVESELRAQFSALCSDCEFQISGLSLPLIPKNISGAARWKIRLRTDLPKGSFNVPVEIEDGDQPAKTYWITGTLAVYRQVPVAIRSLASGERLMSDDFTMQKKDVTFAVDTAPSEKELSAALVGRQVAAGQVIWRGSLRRELALKQGDIVKVSVGTSEWQITMDGVAQNSGYVGDMVRVKVSRTQKLVSGVLKEKGLVEVQ